MLLVIVTFVGFMCINNIEDRLESRTKVGDERQNKNWIEISGLYSSLFELSERLSLLAKTLGYEYTQETTEECFKKIKDTK